MGQTVKFLDHQGKSWKGEERLEYLQESIMSTKPIDALPPLTPQFCFNERALRGTLLYYFLRSLICGQREPQADWLTD